MSHIPSKAMPHVRATKPAPRSGQRARPSAAWLIGGIAVAAGGALAALGLRRTAAARD